MVLDKHHSPAERGQGKELPPDEASRSGVLYRAEHNVARIDAMNGFGVFTVASAVTEAANVGARAHQQSIEYLRSTTVPTVARIEPTPEVSAPQTVEAAPTIAPEQFTPATDATNPAVIEAEAGLRDNFVRIQGEVVTGAEQIALAAAREQAVPAAYVAPEHFGPNPEYANTGGQ